MEITKLKLSQIRIDGGTQQRVPSWNNSETAAEYGDAMKAGAKFPPIIVFFDGSEYWLGDGFLRVEGARHAAQDTDEDDCIVGDYIEDDAIWIDCEVRQGSQADAQWFSFSANSTHGLRRSNDDKARAVKGALLHLLGAGKSNRQIADHVGVDEGTVRRWREKLTAEIPQSKKRTGRDGRSINVTNIGKRNPAAAAAHPAPQPEPVAPVSANSTHGLPRSNEDEQRAVRAALLHPLGAGLSDSEIAEHVGVEMPKPEVAPAAAAPPAPQPAPAAPVTRAVAPAAEPPAVANPPLGATESLIKKIDSWAKYKMEDFLDACEGIAGCGLAADFVAGVVAARAGTSQSSCVAPEDEFGETSVCEACFYCPDSVRARTESCASRGDSHPEMLTAIRKAAALLEAVIAKLSAPVAGRGIQSDNRTL